MNSICFLYSLTFPNGKQYFGVSKNPKNRLIQHLRDSKNSNRSIHVAIRKYGRNSLKQEILACGETEYIKELECRAIEKFNSYVPNGYNETAGGDGLINPPSHVRDKMRTRTGKLHTEETKQKMRESSQHKKHSDESKYLISIANSGRVRSEETRKRISEIQTGKIRGQHSDEHKRKLSESHMGKNGQPMTEDNKLLLSLKWSGSGNPNFGRDFSDEHRKKLSDSHKGKKQSEVTKLRRSESLKLSWLKRRTKKD